MSEEFAQALHVHACPALPASQTLMTTDPAPLSPAREENPNAEEDEGDDIITPEDVREFTLRNMATVHRCFPPDVYQVNRDFHLMSVIATGKFVHASDVDDPHCVIPPLYWTGAAVQDINTAGMLQALGEYESVIPREEYTDEVLRAVTPFYAALLNPQNSVEGVTTEALQTLATMIRSMVMIRTHSVCFLNSTQQGYSGAAGILCKRTIVNGVDLIDNQAGYLGKCDWLLFFGKKDLYGDSTPFCPVELKIVPDSGIVSLDGVHHRWFTGAKALLAQVLGSLFGHKAPFAIAMTNQGFKVFLLQRLGEEAENRWVVRQWPPGPHFHVPSQSRTEIDDGLRILAEFVRIATTLESEKAPIQTVSRAKKAAKRKERPASGSSSPKSPVRKRKMDQDTIYLLPTGAEGQDVVVTSLCMSTRFAQEELLAMTVEAEQRKKWQFQFPSVAAEKRDRAAVGPASIN